MKTTYKRWLVCAVNNHPEHAKKMSEMAEFRDEVAAMSYAEWWAERRAKLGGGYWIKAVVVDKKTGKITAEREV